MNFRRLLIIPVFLLVYCSCKKNSSSVTFTPSLYFLNGDTSNKNLILFSSEDSVTFNVILSSTYLLSKNASLKIGVDDDARTAYNSNHGTNYEAMPSGAYSFKDTSTIYTSSIFDTIPVIIYKNQLDLSKQYMLAINIVSSTGININLDESIIYFNTVTNTLAGLYNSTGVKISYNGDAADSSVASTDSFSIAKNLTPLNTTFSQLDYADLGSNGWQYLLSFNSDNPGSPPTFTVGENPVLANSIQPGSFKILGSSYDSTTKAIYIKSAYKNTSGNERIIQETLTLR